MLLSNKNRWILKRVSWLAHTLLENEAEAVTTPIPCSWGRQCVMMMKQLMIHTLLSEVVKGTFAHKPWKTACDCTTVAGIDSYLLHRVARPVAFSHDNRDTQHCCFQINIVMIDVPKPKYFKPLYIWCMYIIGVCVCVSLCTCECVSRCISVPSSCRWWSLCSPSVGSQQKQMPMQPCVCVFPLCLILSVLLALSLSPPQRGPINSLPWGGWDNEDYSIKHC